MEIRRKENKWKFLWKRINLTDAKCDGGHEMEFFLYKFQANKERMAWQSDLCNVWLNALQFLGNERKTEYSKFL